MLFRSSLKLFLNLKSLLNKLKSNFFLKICYFYCLYLSFKSLTDYCQILKNNFRFSMFYFRFQVFDCWMIVNIIFENFFDSENFLKLSRFSLFYLDLMNQTTFDVLSFKFSHFNKRAFFKNTFQRDFQFWKYLYFSRWTLMSANRMKIL